jgi:hypothetical protein
MNKYIFILFLLPFMMGCDKEEIDLQSDKHTNLIIYWDNPENGFFGDGWKNYATISIYDSEEEYLNPTGKPVLFKKLEDVSYVYEHPQILLPKYKIHFNDIKPQKYWIKFFNIYNKSNESVIIEHNQNAPFVFKEPLSENATTTIRVRPKNVYTRSFTIKKIEYYDIPEWINLKEKIELSIMEIPFDEYDRNPFDPSGYVMDSKILLNEQSHISYEPNITIDAIGPNRNYYHSKIFVTLKNENFYLKNYDEINIIDLLISNAHFGNEYIKLNDNNKIKYKLYVDWNIYQEK